MKYFSGIIVHFIHSDHVSNNFPVKITTAYKPIPSGRQQSDKSTWERNRHKVNVRFTALPNALLIDCDGAVYRFRDVRNVRYKRMQILNEMGVKSHMSGHSSTTLTLT